MRLAGAVAMSLVLALPAVAQTRPDAPAKPPAAAKPARPNPVAASYAALSPTERVAIQSDLIWIAEYVGLADGDFGDRAINAVKTFQRSQGGKETGVLNPQERAALAAAAKVRQEAVGWRIADEPVSGARLGLPAKLVPQSAAATGGTRFTSRRGEVQVETFRIATSGTTLAAVFEQQRKEPAERKPDYNVLRPDFFVISGLQGLKKFYVRAQARGEEVRGVTILYDQAMAGLMDPVVVAMSSAFAAFPDGAVAGPPPRRKVDYASGAVVSAAGHVVTSFEATDGCIALTVAGLGDAERVADDRARGIALLRVYGAADLQPLALAAAPTGATDVTLFGIPEPPARAAAMSLPARLTPASNGPPTVAPAPAPGLAGAAVLDGTGRLLGLVSPAPGVATTAAAVVVAAAAPAPAGGAALAPARAIKTLLDQEKVAPATDAAVRPADAAKTSVLRVICTRK
jgi:peptidoglycan hydrolase-like protein with peptidoglycan-binding domain